VHKSDCGRTSTPSKSNPQTLTAPANLDSSSLMRRGRILCPKKIQRKKGRTGVLLVLVRRTWTNSKTAETGHEPAGGLSRGWRPRPRWRPSGAGDPARAYGWRPSSAPAAGVQARACGWRPSARLLPAAGGPARLRLAAGGRIHGWRSRSRMVAWPADGCRARDGVWCRRLEEDETRVFKAPGFIFFYPRQPPLMG
jgi:hypothetical protein